MERVAALSARLVDELAGCRFELRHRGLMMAFKFDSEMAGMLATKLMFDNGVFATYAGNDTSVLQFLPPLTITDDELTDLIGRVRQVFGG